MRVCCRYPQPRLDLLDRYTLAGQRRRVVAAQRVRMGQALRHAGDRGVAAHELRETLLGEREKQEQHIVVAQPATDALRVRAQPRLERVAAQQPSQGGYFAPGDSFLTTGPR